MKYKHIHKLAKLIVCLINTVLVLVFYHSHIELLIIFINISYFFGVNTVAYVLESILHTKHEHDKL